MSRAGVTEDLLAAVASLLSVVWFLTAFALRIVIQVVRHHDTGVRGNAGPAWSLAWVARVLLTASLVAVGIAPILVALDVIQPTSSVATAAVGLVGTLLAIGGIALTYWAQLAMGASWRIGVDRSERTTLVTTGPFAIVRNPIFSTMALTAVGLTLMAPTVIGLVGLAVLSGSLELQVRGVEEPYLAQMHGAAYTTYAARIGRFVPRPLRRKSSPPGLAGS